ncbi:MULTISPECIES: hypothetical protein [Planktothricoides]|uniref:Uncharacterized protein n=1 Tax=Planktothricoides raciborskii FACHB-1370 TaxID=2949576 RepID=A0ABR8E9I0_9CYAN|nr:MULTISPECIES: hypothetical protein [Planktothricoides]MBD2543504.1 hypothetical protein [Planktothricoides raciborskii FACHB-1370]MBD2581194.1 hypothetical protein [Planktothricoides raciborskii FACHB-1261]
MAIRPYKLKEISIFTIQYSLFTIYYSLFTLHYTLHPEGADENISRVTNTK